MEQTANFPALSYVQSGKKNRKFTSFDPTYKYTEPPILLLFHSLFLSFFLFFFFSFFLFFFFSFFLFFFFSFFLFFSFFFFYSSFLIVILTFTRWACVTEFERFAYFYQNHLPINPSHKSVHQIFELPESSGNVVGMQFLPESIYK